MMPLSPIWLSLELAAVTTVILLLIGVPLAWWLARSTSRASAAVNAVVTLPLVLPPSVLGFYVLVALGPNGPIGILTEAIGLGTLNFTFTGLVVGSVIYSLPFMVQPLEAAFAGIGQRPMEVAATLRCRPLDAFFNVMLPLARQGIVTGVIMTFAHTIGEFGVVLMIGGNIPDKTQVVSTEIYTYVEAMEYTQAHILAGGMLVFSFIVLLALNWLNGRNKKGRTT
ncbi:molybdate ABC transporter permease subunit [Sutterella massiliensis]|uniref:Molybdenum transport system permease n=2 Tax=Sutterella massiliensis TaxID=1816689 RepID=A0ABS2DS06_9BURK|nr:molybdate ABC transporter permease subunit [Sutterella massiliensis]MBM6704120.1 molybdate ABC transporter permease subunit [Sutterella massiliensis]